MCMTKIHVTGVEMNSVWRKKGVNLASMFKAFWNWGGGRIIILSFEKKIGAYSIQ